MSSLMKFGDWVSVNEVGLKKYNRCNCNDSSLCNKLWGLFLGCIEADFSSKYSSNT